MKERILALAAVNLGVRSLYLLSVLGGGVLVSVNFASVPRFLPSLMKPRSASS